MLNTTLESRPALEIRFLAAAKIEEMKFGGGCCRKLRWLLLLACQPWCWMERPFRSRVNPDFARKNWRASRFVTSQSGMTARAASAARKRKARDDLFQ